MWSAEVQSKHTASITFAACFAFSSLLRTIWSASASVSCIGKLVASFRDIVDAWRAQSAPQQGACSFAAIASSQTWEIHATINSMSRHQVWMALTIQLLVSEPTGTRASRVSTISLRCAVPLRISGSMYMEIVPMMEGVCWLVTVQLYRIYIGPQTW